MMFTIAGLAEAQIGLAVMGALEQAAQVVERRAKDLNVSAVDAKRTAAAIRALDGGTTF